MSPFISFLFVLVVVVVKSPSVQSDEDAAIADLLVQLKSDPHDVSKLKEIGLLYDSQGDHAAALKYLSLAIEQSRYDDKEAVWNYVTVLYNQNDIESAREFIDHYYQDYSRDIDTVLLSGKMNLCMGRIAIAQERFEEALSILDNPAVAHQILLAHEHAKACVQSRGFVARFLKIYSHEPEVVFQAAILLSSCGNWKDALELFERVLNMEFDREAEALLMIATTHQAMGENDLAKSKFKILYESGALNYSSTLLVGFLSNYGLLLKNSKNDSEIVMGVNMLQEALEINPYFENALINLASHYRAEDDIDTSVRYLKRAAAFGFNSRQLVIEIAKNTMDEVMVNWDRVLDQRRNIVQALENILSLGPPHPQSLQEYSVLNLHFNIQYHSFNDRYIQELIYKVYVTNIKHFAEVSRFLIHNSNDEVFIQPKTNPSGTASQPRESLFLTHGTKKRKIRIGFISKSFGVFEPHGLLLDGVVKYLPRSFFKVYILKIMLDKDMLGHVISPSLADYADEIVDIPQSHTLAAEIIENLNLDILVFADSLCEPINHVLMYSRYAKIQILFW